MVYDRDKASHGNTVLLTKTMKEVVAIRNVIVEDLWLPKHTHTHTHTHMHD